MCSKKISTIPLIVAFSSTEATLFVPEYPGFLFSLDLYVKPAISDLFIVLVYFGL